MRKTTLVDDDGNEIPPPPPESALAQVIYLMEYARRRKFRIPTIQIGDVIVQVDDLTFRDKGGAPIADLDRNSDMGRILLRDEGDA